MNSAKWQGTGRCTITAIEKRAIPHRPSLPFGTAQVKACGSTTVLCSACGGHVHSLPGV
ncbi:MAG: hypothetical protein AB1847_07620 [bacterium]